MTNSKDLNFRFWLLNVHCIEGTLFYGIIQPGELPRVEPIRKQNVLRNPGKTNKLRVFAFLTSCSSASASRKKALSSLLFLAPNFLKSFYSQEWTNGTKNIAMKLAFASELPCLFIQSSQPSRDYVAKSLNKFFRIDSVLESIFSEFEVY